MLVLARVGVRRDRRGPAGAGALRAAPREREPARPLRGEPRPAQRPASGQLPERVHAPGADQCRPPRHPDRSAAAQRTHLVAARRVGETSVRRRATLPLVTSRRAEAYGRVMRILEGPDVESLRAVELDEIREATDALFFCEDLEADSAARDAADAIADLAVGLVEPGRWSEDAAEPLASEALACGPVAFAG